MPKPNYTRINDTDARRAQLLKAALSVAQRIGYHRVTRVHIAKIVGCSPSLITVHFGTMRKLRKAIMEHAIEHGKRRIIAQGLMAGDSHAEKAPEEIKARVRKALA